MVGDWGGFEALVAKLHDTGDVTVERDVILPGKSGAPRQIDVLIRHRQGYLEHLIVVECKHLKSALKRLHVDALATTLREVGASRGVIFASGRYQEGAITQAKHENIDLFVVRDLTRDEWGNSGRIFEIFLQFVQVAAGRKVRMSGTYRLNSPDLQPDPDDASLAIRFGEPNGDSVTRLAQPDGTLAPETLEDHLKAAMRRAADEMLRRKLLINSGAEGTYYLDCSTVIRPPEPFMIPRKNGVAIIQEIALPTILRIDQSRITADRAESLEFALAVESKVTGEVVLASRKIGGSITVLQQRSEAKAIDPDDVVKNGELLQVVIGGYFNVDDVDQLISVSDHVLRPFEYSDPNEV